MDRKFRKNSLKGDWNQLKDELAMIFNKMSAGDLDNIERDIYTGIEYLREDFNAPKGYVKGEIYLTLSIYTDGDTVNVDAYWDGDETELGGVAGMAWDFEDDYLHFYDDRDLDHILKSC